MMLRSDITNIRIQPVENLTTNPNFERVNTGTTIVRRNLHRNPGIKSTFQGWAKSPGTNSGVAATAVSGGAFSGGPLGLGYYDMTWTSPSDAGNRRIQAGWSTSVGTITPLQTYTISAYVWSETGAPIRLSVDWQDASGSYVSLSTQAPQTVGTSPATATRLSFTAKAPLGISRAIIFIFNGRSGTVPAGDHIAGTGVLLENRPALLPYFDGLTTDESAITYSWEGAAHDSASIARSSVVEVRRNLSIDPRATSLTSNGPKILGDRYAGEGTYDLATGINGPLSLTTAARYTVTAARVSHGFNIAGNVEATSALLSYALPVTAGTTYTASVWIYQTAALDVAIRARAADSSGAWIASQVIGPTVKTIAGGWVRIYVTYTAPVNAACFALTASSLSGNIDTVGSAWMATGLLLEASTILGDYFDGITTPDADLVSTWVGAENNSSSTLQGVRPQGIAIGLSGRVGIRSWNTFGGHASLRNISVGSYAGIWLPNPNILVPGKTYTALARAYYPVASSNGGDIQARSLLYGGSYGGGGTNQYTQFPNTPGTYSLRLTFTVNGNEQFIRLGGSGDTNLSVYWDQLLITEGVYRGPYLDGDMPGVVWRGTSHASTSVGYPGGV